MKYKITIEHHPERDLNYYTAWTRDETGELYLDVGTTAEIAINTLVQRIATLKIKKPDKIIEVDI